VALLRAAAERVPVVLPAPFGATAAAWLLAEADCHAGADEVGQAAVDLVDSMPGAPGQSEFRVVMSTLPRAVRFARSILDAHSAALASRSTPALPDGAAHQIATVLSQWVEIEGPHEPEVVALEALFRSWLSSSATDPEPATPDGPTIGTWCERCSTNVTGSHYHCGKCGQRSGMMGHRIFPCPPVAPQAPAEPTEKQCTHRMVPSVGGPACYFCGHRDAPAGPAVPEDTGADYDAQIRWADGPDDDYGDDLTARFLKPNTTSREA
jgi:hypothetical protein